MTQKATDFIKFNWNDFLCSRSTLNNEKNVVDRYGIVSRKLRKSSFFSQIEQKQNKFLYTYSYVYSLLFIIYFQWIINRRIQSHRTSTIEVNDAIIWWYSSRYNTYRQST